MKLRLLGTGGPLPDPARAGPAALVACGTDHVLVDCGAGALDQLLAAGMRPERVNTVLFSRTRLVHTAGFARFVLTSWLLGRREPLTVLGPAGVETLCARTLEVLAEDIHSYLARQRLDPNGIRLDAHELDVRGGPTQFLSRPGLTVQAMSAAAQAEGNALGYRLGAGATSVTFMSGPDVTDDRTEFAADSDVLVHEAYCPEALAAYVADRPELSAIAHEVRRLTGTAADVATLADRARVHALVLTAVAPPSFDEAARRAEVQRAYAGRVVVPADQFTWTTA